MIWVWDERCDCGHDVSDHDRGTLCFRCCCPVFHDQNERDTNAERVGLPAR